MKIFSLETKKHLVLWSAVLGLVIDLFFTFWPPFFDCVHEIGTKPFTYIWPSQCERYHGFPFSYFLPNELSSNFAYQNMIISSAVNLLVWIAVVFAALFAIRHFRKKHYQITAKQN